MAEDVPTLGLFEAAADVTDCLQQGLNGSGVLLSQELLEPGEGHLYRVEIRGIGRQEKRPGPAVLDDMRHERSFVRGQVVHNDTVTLERVGTNYVSIQASSGWRFIVTVRA